MSKKISVQENAERAFLIEKMYHLDNRTNGLFCGLGEELETYRKIKNLKQDLVLKTEIKEDDKILIDGQYVGQLKGLKFNVEFTSKTLDTDIKGFYHVLRACVPVLRDGGGGSITALTTAAIHKYISTDGLSSVPKSGVQHLCTAISREEGHNGIRANCVAVGLIAVGLSQEIDSPPGGILDQWMQQVPLGRAGDPNELFDTVVFLASENAGYISGQSIPVDGGYSA